jgi:hypothetical protein
MLDPTLVSVLLGVLAVLGTLGGALGGTILANRHAMKLEELRIEQEKLKRNTEIIEETYSQLMLYNDLSNNIASDVLSSEVPSQDLTEKSKEIYTVFNRIFVLVKLYNPSLSSGLGDIYNLFIPYWMDVEHLSNAKRQRQKTEMINELIEKVNQERDKFIHAQLKLRASLEALVR